MANVFTGGTPLVPTDTMLKPVNKINGGDTYEISKKFTNFAAEYFVRNANYDGCIENGIKYPAEMRNLPPLHIIYDGTIGINRSDKLFFFNANHLGSGSLITDGNGRTYQTLAYCPYGESLINVKQAGSYEEKYQFGGKIKDEESGLNYFEARYYDENVGFISVDPLAEKFPHISGYAYCNLNPIMLIDPTGMYFEQGSKHERQAAKIERQAERRATKLENRANRLETRGKSTGDLRERAGELRQSAQDVRDMRNDKTTEYRYSKASNKDNPAGKGLPVTMLTGQNAAGDNVVTMFTESNMGSKLHESRHGAQNARGEYNIVTGEGYSVADEVSAYRAQYSWSGKFTYIPYINTDIPSNLEQLITGGINSFAIKITNISIITPALINTFVDNPLNEKTIYPPESISIDIWNSNR